jgi:hypothetical protein
LIKVTKADDSSKSRGSDQNVLGPREKLCAMAGLANQIFFPGSGSVFKADFSRGEFHTFLAPNAAQKLRPEMA